jgi:hypothetical protein
MKMTRAEFREEVDVVKMIAKEALGVACAKQNPYAFGHAFMWCVAKVNGKNVKFLIGSISGCENINQIEIDVNQAVKEIDYTWINMD